MADVLYDVDDCKRVAIVVTRNGAHAGICFQSSLNGGARILHLAYHRYLRNDKVSSEYILVVPDLEPEEQDSIAAVADAVWEANKNQSVPYGFGSPLDCFDQSTGRYLVESRTMGLTCATFVLAIFERVSLRLVDYDSWPLRVNEDKAWQEGIVKDIEEYVIKSPHMLPFREQDKEYIENLTANIPAIRFRPYEVAASGLETQATKFEDIVNLTNDLQSRSPLKIS